MKMPEIHPPEIAKQFLLKYKEWKIDPKNKPLGVFTEKHMTAMTTTLMSNPLSMIPFYAEVLGIVVETTLKESDNNFEELSTCLIQYTQVMTSFLGNVVGIISMSPEQRKAMLQRQMDVIKQANNIKQDKPFPNQYTSDPDEIFKNLDFKLPDLDNME